MHRKHQVDKQYCSIHSSHALEPLIGSAPRTDYWILLEYPYSMSAKALRENRLPDEVKHYLAALQSAIPSSRVLLIRKQSSSPGSNPVLYLADGREGHALLHKYHLTSHSDLLKLDITAILSGGPASEESLCNDHFFLVCTNGKRDACCSKWGLPLFNSLRKQYGEMVWQSSHVGGHRFAPNLICLPYGIYYGRVPLDQASWIADRHLHGRLTLDYYRGRAVYPAPAQAAEYLLRLETGEDRIEHYHLETFAPIAENQWEISFLSTQDHAIYHLHIESFQTGMDTFESCSAPSERKAVIAFRLQQPIQVS